MLSLNLTNVWSANREVFDLIFSINVMQFISDQSKILSALWKSLKHTGKLGIQVPLKLVEEEKE